MGDISIEDAFAELSGGRDRVTLDAICEWNIIKELLEEGTLTRTAIADMAIEVRVQR